MEGASVRKVDRMERMLPTEWQSLTHNINLGGKNVTNNMSFTNWGKIRIGSCWTKGSDRTWCMIKATNRKYRFAQWPLRQQQITNQIWIFNSTSILLVAPPGSHAIISQNWGQIQYIAKPEPCWDSLINALDILASRSFCSPWVNWNVSMHIRGGQSPVHFYSETTHFNPAIGISRLRIVFAFTGGEKNTDNRVLV